MTDTWSSGFYNRWLRSQAKASLRERSTLNLPMLEQSELVSVLAIILKSVKHMNTIKVRIEACHGEIKLFVDDSKETSMLKQVVERVG